MTTDGLVFFILMKKERLVMYSDNKYKLNDEIAFEGFGEMDMIAFDSSNEKTHVFNHTASILLRSVNGNTLSEIKARFVNTVKNEYINVTEENLSDDADEMIVKFLENKILVEVE